MMYNTIDDFKLYAERKYLDLRPKPIDVQIVRYTKKLIETKKNALRAMLEQAAMRYNGTDDEKLIIIDRYCLKIGADYKVAHLPIYRGNRY